MNESDKLPKTEFRILEWKQTGVSGFAWAWFHGKTKIGDTEELESYLNRLGDDGWDVAHMMASGRILLRRKAR